MQARLLLTNIQNKIWKFDVILPQLPVMFIRILCALSKQLGLVMTMLNCFDHMQVNPARVSPCCTFRPTRWVPQRDISRPMSNDHVSTWTCSHCLQVHVTTWFGLCLHCTCTGVDRWGTGGRVPPLFRAGGQHSNCPPTFQFRKIARHIA